MNMGWAANRQVQDLFRQLLTESVDATGADPFLRLARASQTRLDELAADRSYVARANALLDDLKESLTDHSWFEDRRESSPLKQVAYFSLEYGITTSLPQYSGGLGVLAGDHLKAANDLGVPLVAFGLLYQHGYFRQTLDSSGWQQEHFPLLDPHNMALEPVPDLTVEVVVDGHAVTVGAWRARVGRITLYLLDTNRPENRIEDQQITDRLYGGGVDQRIRQEMVLGIGGIRMLKALGIEPDVYHLNEGHAAFLTLERIRVAMADHGLTFPEAIEYVRPAHLFTTHTPVPAGIDRFPRDVVEHRFGWWFSACGTTIEDLMALGQDPSAPAGAELNMAVLALRLSGAANGVSELHGAVSRRLFESLWPGVPEDERPISHVTNGAHGRTWVAPEMSDLLDRHIGSDWPEAPAERWGALLSVSDDEIRAVRTSAKNRLISFVRLRVRQQLLAAGASSGDVEWTDRLLDPNVLTIGFARRFATYKRATLLLRDHDRLEHLLNNAERPVQFVFAGKAHPADEPGKRLLQSIAQLAAEPRFRERFVLLADYEMAVGRVLTQGVDVWLNNPIRPHEASGTSGMKCVFNGVLNCSILDGWWAEMYENDLGWSIPTATTTADDEDRDEQEAQHLFRLLENVVCPTYYEAGQQRPPRRWLDIVRSATAVLGPKVQASRMMSDYVTRFYEPAAERATSLVADGGRKARELHAWHARLDQSWPTVRIVDMTSNLDSPGIGQVVKVQVGVELGTASPDDLAVEIIHGEVTTTGDMAAPEITRAALVGVDGTLATFQAEVRPNRAGSLGLAVRVLPHHPDMGHVAWTGKTLWLAEDAPI